MRIFNKFIEDPGVLFSYLFGSLYFWIYKLTNGSLKSKKIIIIGVPILDIRKNSKVVIGNNVLLRSRNRGYHINLLSSCKLMTDSGGFIYIGDNTKIYGSCIHASKSILIGKNCLLASNVTIIDRNGHDLEMLDPKNRFNTYGVSRGVIIEDNVWIGANCIITPGVVIGEGSVIMANSVVNKNIGKFTLAGGIPCVELKKYKK